MKSAKAALAAQLRQQYAVLTPETPHTLVEVLRTGQSWFDPVVSPTRLRAEARDEAHGTLVQALGFQSEIIVPLLARGRVLGTITCVLGEGVRRYSAADLVLAEELARRAALAFDNARLYQEARAAQEALEQAHAALAAASGNGAHRQFAVSGQPKFSHQEHIQRRTERARDLGSHGHSASRQRQDDDVVTGEARRVARLDGHVGERQEVGLQLTEASAGAAVRMHPGQPEVRVSGQEPAHLSPGVARGAGVDVEDQAIAREAERVRHQGGLAVVGRVGGDEAVEALDEAVQAFLAGEADAVMAAKGELEGILHAGGVDLAAFEQHELIGVLRTQWNVGIAVKNEDDRGSLRDAVAEVAAVSGLPRRMVYQRALSRGAPR